MGAGTNELFEQSTVELLAVKPGFVLTSENVDDLLLGSTRKSLFFDENVPMYIILHFPATVDQKLASELAERTSLNLEAFVSESNARTSAPALVRQDSFSVRQSRQDQGQLVYGKAMDASTHSLVTQYKDHQIVIWCHSTFLAFTPTKTNSTRVSLSVTMTLNDFNPADAAKNLDVYLEPNDAVTRDRNYNLLRALENDVFLRHHPPRISAASVSTMSSASDSTTRKTKKTGRRHFPITSAISLQVRSVNLPYTDRILLSIDMESTKHVTTAIDLESIELELKTSSAKPITTFEFPIRLQPRDVFTYGFELDCGNVASETATEVPVLIKITARPRISDEEVIAGPTLQSKWNTAIHLPASLKSVKASSVLPPQRMQRSTSNLHVRHAAGPLSPREQQPPPTNALAGINVTITAPPTGDVGQLLHVSVLVSNTSTTTKNLSIDVSRRRKELPRLPEPDKDESETPSSNTYLTNQQILELHQRHTVLPADLICLTNSIKVGILAPEAQIGVSLQYVALRSGLVTLQDLRIVEIGSGTFQELKDLPDVYIR